MNVALRLQSVGHRSPWNIIHSSKRHEGSASFAKTNELSVRLTCNSAVRLPDAGIGDAIRRPWETRKSCPVGSENSSNRTAEPWLQKVMGNQIRNEWNEMTVSSGPIPDFDSFQLSGFVNQLERITGLFPLCSGPFSRDRVRNSIQPEQPL